LTPQPTTTAVLVCEGACNPNRDALEHIVDNDSWADDKGRMMRGSKVLLLRALKHTPHTRVGRGVFGQMWRCDVCQQERKYG